MKTVEDIESYLLKMDLQTEEVRDGTWVIKGLDSIDNLIITIAGPVVVFLLTGERLLGQLVVAGLHGQHRLALPLLALGNLIVPLLLEALLVADRNGDLLLRLNELGLHVGEDLVEHLLRVLRLGDQVVEVRLDQRAQPRKDAHLRRSPSVVRGVWSAVGSFSEWRGVRPPRGTSRAGCGGWRPPARCLQR